MLTFRDVSYAYHAGTKVLQDVNFRLPAASCTLLAGRNGSGKSTIVRLCNGLLRPSSGEVQIRSIPTAAIPVHEIVRDVALMFQHPGDQITERTVVREIMVGMAALGLDRLETRATAALQLVDQSHRASDHPYDLEPSERKLVTLAATVAMQTPVVVLDEPLVGLGPSEVRIVHRVVQRLRDEGRLVLFVAHDVLQAWPLADRVLVLREGRMTMDSPIHDGLTPASVFTAAGMPSPTVERAMALLGIPTKPS